MSNDLYCCDYEALLAPSQEMWEENHWSDSIVENSKHDLEWPSPNRWVNNLLVPSEKRYCLTRTIDEDTVNIDYYVNRKLHRDDGPASIMHAKTGTEFQFRQNGLYHRTNGPAVIKFSNAADLQGIEEGPKEFTAHGKPRYTWSTIWLSFYENGKHLHDRTKCTYRGVRQWYIGDKMCLSAHRVDFDHQDASINWAKPVAPQRSGPKNAFHKAATWLRTVGVLGVNEVWERGELLTRTWKVLDLNWDTSMSFVDDSWNTTFISKEQKSQMINDWLKENLRGRLDPFHPNLFTDEFDEFAFLECFS